MAEDLFLINSEDQIIIKPPKKSFLASRVILLFMATICVFYICTNCLKQIGTRVNSYSSVQFVKQPCDTSNIRPEEIPYLHFPEPLTYSRAECSCNPVRYFAILSMQRSGSGWFETLLNSHMNVSSNGEIFSVKERRANASAIINTLDKVYNLDWYTSASKNECLSAVGFKWMLNQGLMAYHEEIAEYFNKRGVSAIFLFRRNQLHRLVSVLSNSFDRYAKQLNGTHKSHVHSVTEAEVLAKYKPKINTSQLLQDLKHIEELAANVTEYFKSTHHVVLYYEDLINSRTQKVMEIQEFLRLPKMNLKSRQVRIHSKPLSEHVENWDDVCETLKGTQYEHYLNAD